MFVREQVHAEWELLRWMLLLALAAALTLALAGRIAGAADLSAPPRELPHEIDAWSLPMEKDQPEIPALTRDVGLEVWRAIDLQHAQRYDEAILAWSEVQLPCETEVWKHVALGQAYLATGEIEEAAHALDLARSLEPENAVVHYFFGVLQLEQAYLANDWYDAMEPGRTRLIAYLPPQAAPHTKSLYKLKAITELEAALERADTLSPDTSLVPPEWPTQAVMPPTVHDLLLAVRAISFIPKAHNMLGSLYVERGDLERAERHMDEAVSGGLHVLDGYSALGRQFAELGQDGDALRAYLKAAQQEPEKMPALRSAWESLKKAAHL